MKKKYLILTLLFFFAILEYRYPCEFGLCHYEFFYDEIKPEINFLIVQSEPRWKVHQYGCSYINENGVYVGDGNIKTQEECDLYGGKIKPQGYSWNSEKIDLIKNIKLDTLTIKHLIDKANDPEKI